MAGLYFRYGTMNSSKTANLLMIRHNYIESGFKVVILKPETDTRCEYGKIESRVGISAECVMISNESDIDYICKEHEIILVDEAQFLSKEIVDKLYDISFNKVVMCFGLLTDFKQELFEGSKRLIELSDSIQEIKSVCKCGKRAVVNARYKDGVLQTKGEQVVIGAEETYKALCKDCYKKERIKSYGL